MNDQPSFVAAICAGNLDAAGPFADWLQEQGREGCAKALRSRWAAWRAERILEDHYIAAQVGYYLEHGRRHWDESIPHGLPTQAIATAVAQAHQDQQDRHFADWVSDHFGAHYQPSNLGLRDLGPHQLIDALVRSVLFLGDDHKSTILLAQEAKRRLVFSKRKPK